MSENLRVEALRLAVQSVGTMGFAHNGDAAGKMIVDRASDFLVFLSPSAAGSEGQGHRPRRGCRSEADRG
ncbi:hypothetical protein UFOVP747_13 [uncultured Caudovirales phage]|uniref:Uncharacterized protein n=1 Tax=uncultured Caudovirales phage TaxID=2100421 RepID=A0A6J5ND21_9CAUD|nr:hypothetical protein UFOVP675_17 [uncultured Caudovirales phage]CAB5225327.1 hypothetical protein UFOVP747_13 [uncultured Caudovirales phage]